MDRVEMILILTGIAGFLAFALCQASEMSSLAWLLLGFIAGAGGVWAGYDERINR